MGLVERLAFRPHPKQEAQPKQAKDKKGHKKWAEIDRYIVDLLVPSDPVLDAALCTSQAAGLPPINVSPNQGKLLMVLAQAVGARAILEIGTLGGYSTIWLARALAPGGRVITLEANPMHAKIARANVAHAGFADRVDMRLGKALNSLPTLANEAPFDFIYIDADQVNAANYFQWAVKLSRRGSLIVTDNVIRHGSIIDGENCKPAVQGLRRFYDLVTAEPKVSITALQTVGSNGHDGFAIAVVTADQ